MTQKDEQHPPAVVSQFSLPRMEAFSEVHQGTLNLSHDKIIKGGGDSFFTPGRAGIDFLHDLGDSKSPNGGNMTFEIEEEDEIKERPSITRQSAKQPPTPTKTSPARVKYEEKDLLSKRQIQFEDQPTQAPYSKLIDQKTTPPKTSSQKKRQEEEDEDDEDEDEACIPPSWKCTLI